jgi:DNA helicase HerA-like ATPase
MKKLISASVIERYTHFLITLYKSSKISANVIVENFAKKYNEYISLRGTINCANCAER